jgi:hypothetical protein
MISRLFAALAAATVLAACADDTAPIPSLPSESSTATSCLYGYLRATPGVTGVNVYVTQAGSVVHYDYRTARGEMGGTDLYVMGESSLGRYQYSTDYMAIDNPVAQRATDISAKCRADGFYYGSAVPLSAYEGRQLVQMEPKPAPNDDNQDVTFGWKFPDVDFWPFD